VGSGAERIDKEPRATEEIVRDALRHAREDADNGAASHDWCSLGRFSVFMKRFTGPGRSLRGRCADEI
jgi:hypothetical protein